MKNTLYIGLLALGMAACSSGSSESTSEMSNEEKVKFEQYMVAGETLYTQYCSNCHQIDGSGLAELYPPLNNSDYLKEHAESLPCIIKNGVQGEITVNGVTYNQIMPGLNMLTDLEIAEIATYVSNAWDNDLGYVGVNDAAAVLQACD